MTKIIIESGLALVCIFLIYVHVKIIVAGFFSRRWPTVIGRLIGAETKSKDRLVQNFSGEQMHYPSVLVEYIVEGRVYTCDRIAFIHFFESSNRNEYGALIGRINRSNPIVSYHPKRHEYSVLLAGPQARQFFWLMAIVLTFAVVSCYALYVDLIELGIHVF